MIGVVAEEPELAAVAEFFELFKSPWEFYQPGTHYDVLLSSTNWIPETDATLVVSYGSHENASGEPQSIRTAHGPKLIGSAVNGFPFTETTFCGIQTPMN